MATGFSSHPAPRPHARGPSLAGVASDGILAGMVGAATVALWFLGYDALTREPLFTPSTLGRALAFGDRPEPTLPVDLAAVAIYTAIHGGLFLAFGIAVSALRATIRNRIAPWLLPGGLFLALELGFLLLAEVAAPCAADVIGQVPILLGNALAAATMSAYLLVWSGSQAESASADRGRA